MFTIYPILLGLGHDGYTAAGVCSRQKLVWVHNAATADHHPRMLFA